MISSKLDSVAAAPATLLSLRRSGMAGLAMARLTGRYDRVLEAVVLPGNVRATTNERTATDCTAVDRTPTTEAAPERAAAPSLLRA